jgi:hypothetical protein
MLHLANLQQGRATKDVLHTIWRDQDAIFLTDLMKKFGLLCSSDGVNFTIPFSTPKEPTPKWKEDPANLTCFFKFHLFLPDSLFHVLVVNFVNRTKQGSPNFVSRISRNASIVLIDGHTTYLQLAPQHQIKVVIERREDHVPLKVVEAIENEIAGQTDLWAKKLSYKVLVHCPKCIEQNNSGMVELKSLDYCSAQPQCRISKVEKQKVNSEWNESKSVAEQQLVDEKEAEKVLSSELSFDLNAKLQPNWKYWCGRLGFNPAALTHSGYEIQELIWLVYNKKGREGLREFYAMLQKDGENASVELIDNSPASVLFK